MDNVLTLVSASPNGLSVESVAQTGKALNRLGATTYEPIWLAPSQACDIHFSNLSIEDAEQVARDSLKSIPIDILAQSQQNHKKKLLIADMDSTIVQGETLDDVATLAGIGPQIADITARAMNGEIRFEDALRERIAMLAGMDPTLFDQVAADLTLNPGAETLVRTMSAHGAYTALVSGGFRFFTARVAQWIGFDLDKGNEIEIINNHFSGEIIEPIVSKTTKQETLEAIVKKRKIDMAETLAVGDGANDIPMLQTAGLGVAYYAKPIVTSQVRAQVAHSDLTTLLYYQGYKKSGFVSN